MRGNLDLSQPEVRRIRVQEGKLLQTSFASKQDFNASMRDDGVGQLIGKKNMNSS